MRIKIFPMGFGESVLIHNDDSGLLVDCGSESDINRTYFRNVEQSIRDYTCSALISHFHEDHINGFGELIKNGCRFERVYIPHIFSAQGSHNYQVDFLIIKYLLEQLNYIKEQSYHVWDLLRDLTGAEQSIRLLQRGSHFVEVNTEFVALWPIPNEISHVQFEKVFTMLTWLGQFKQEIIDLSEHLSGIAVELEELDGDVFEDNPNDNPKNRHRLCQELHGKVVIFIHNINGLKARVIETMRQEDVNNIKVKNRIKDQYRKLELNNTSIVFQSLSPEQPVLMTGDIMPEKMKKIALNKVSAHPDCALHTYYYAIKAPHHGTASGYFAFGACSNFDYLLISNGETPRSEKTRGRISFQYILRNRTYKICCTNRTQGRCDVLSNNDVFQPCCQNSLGGLCARMIMEI